MSLPKTKDPEADAGIPNLPPEVRAAAEAMDARLDAIRNAPFPPDDSLPELAPKQLERIEAFELRAEFRRSQGRPV